jgi:hemolysin III
MPTAPPMSQTAVPRLRGVSHSVAAVLALAAATVVVALAPPGRATIALAVYGVGLVALFTGSALYHRWPGPPRFKPVLQRIDHGTIYLFIAASYTPIVVLALHGALAWTMLAIMWTGAVAGVAFAIGWIHAPAPVIAASYLALGWVVVITVPQLVVTLPLAPLVLLGAGALLYSLGAVIYTTQRPNPWPRTFGFHEIFHALVIAAAAVQYIAIIGWVLPAA